MISPSTVTKKNENFRGDSLIEQYFRHLKSGCEPEAGYYSFVEGKADITDSILSSYSKVALAI